AVRAVKARMNAKQENPEARNFKYRDMRAHARAERAKIVAAILTVLRAYVVAGRPESVKPSRWRGWDRTARGALVWCGLADPFETAATIKAQNPAEANLAG